MTGVIDLRLGARGTNYYGSFRDFLPPDKNNGTQLDFHSAIFATGAIGEWLFTGAYNSSRSLNEDCNCDNRLFRTYQFSEQNYPVYGDSSKVDVVAPSIDSVFLRFERSARIPGSDPDYAMWGDYNTEEFARRSRFSVPLAKNLTFQAQNELSLSSQKNAIYPDRTIFGLNWAVIPGVSVSLAQQYYSSGQYSGNSITSLSVNGEHKLGSDTTLTGRYSILGGANEMTTQGAIGINNRWTIASGLRLNVAYEHVFGNFFGRTLAGQQYAQPYAFGQAASAIGFDGGDSYSVGHFLSLITEFSHSKSSVF